MGRDWNRKLDLLRMANRFASVSCNLVSVLLCLYFRAFGEGDNLIFIVVRHFAVQRVKWCIKWPVTLYYVPRCYIQRNTFFFNKKVKKKHNSLSTFLLLWRETFIVYIFLHNLLKFSHGSPSPTKKERDVLDGFPQQFIGQANSWHLVPAFSVRNKPNFHASYWK